MKNILLALGLFSLIGCAGPKGSDQNSPSWAGKMQTTAKAFQDLLPYLYNSEKFSKKENRKMILKKIDRFDQSIHQIDSKAAEKILGDDPYVLQGLINLKEYSQRALITFKRGDTKSAQVLLKASTSTCFKCHTRQDMGPKSLTWKDLNIKDIETDGVEKAHLLVSMRQYEDAKLYLKEYLSNKELAGEFDIMYENALHYYLMISMRGQNTFQSALNFLQAKELVVKTPLSLHETIKGWRKDLSYYNKNKSKLKPNLKTATQVLKRNKNTYSEKNLINDLVASGLLHEFLMGERSKIEKAKAYRLLGAAYDELVIAGFWDLPEVYYEMCIHYAPQSPLAQTCFRQLKDNITFGYSGSRGTMIPSKEYERIEVLRKKAGAQ